MKQLTDYQKTFLLEQFFKNEQYAGWRNIATNLLEKGECIVPGDKCIWNGQIGNWIKTEKSTIAIDCLLYTFNLDNFLSSGWYKQISNDYINILSSKKRNIEEEYYDICNL